MKAKIKLNELVHDLRSPITVSKTLAKLSMEDTQEPSSHRSFEKILVQMEKLEDLLDSLAPNHEAE